jgi:hypothetical protein
LGDALLIEASVSTSYALSLFDLATRERLHFKKGVSNEADLVTSINLLILTIVAI